MKFLTGFMFSALVTLAWSGATAILPGGCVKKPQQYCRPTEYPEPRPPGPRTFPVAYKAPGQRTTGSGTHRLRTFRLRTEGFLCCVEEKEEAGPSRTRTPVSFDTRFAGWRHQVRITVEKTASFRIILRSGNPNSFDSFEFEDVRPGIYAFTLDSLACWKDPVDVAVEFRGRTIRTRTTYPRVMNHPAREDPATTKRGPEGPLLSEYFNASGR